MDGKCSGKHLFNPPISEFLFGLEESIATYLVEAAHRVDQMDKEKPLNPSDFQSLIDQYLIASIEIYDSKGNLLRGWPSPIPSIARKTLLRDLIERKRSVVIDLIGKPLSEDHWFSIAILRKTNPGILLFISMENRSKGSSANLRFRGRSPISVSEKAFSIFPFRMPNSTSSPIRIPFAWKKEEDSFLKGSLQSQQPLSRFLRSTKGEEIFEVVKSFSLKDQPMGLIRIGYSSQEIQPLLSQLKKNVFLSIIFFLILGLSAITLIWVNQNRHLKKVKAMENRIQLAERLSSLGHLAAGIAHEIRNPLNAIGMGLQRLKREFLPQEESKKEEYLSFAELILKEIRRVNEIIEQFLTLSRPSQLNMKLSSLQELLRNLITLLQEEASSQGIQIQAGKNADLPLIKMDNEKLTQAFMNIMKNGMQAMEKGGIPLVQTQTFKDRIEVSVSDSGSGIPPEEMEKIFNYYYTTKEKGVGLGLPIAHRIIEAHGGQLKIESQVGVGTKVTVRLPI